MVTLKEIAKAVGVSTTTVSRVLNYDPTLSMSAAKRQAIIETAEALNYATPRNRAKAQADDPALQRLAIVHFLTAEEEIADPFYVGVRLGIERRCRDLRCEIVTVFRAPDRLREESFQGVSGVVAIGRQPPDDLAWLGAHAAHLVCADFDPDDERIDSVVSDLGAATDRILDMLDGKGYRRIAFVGTHDAGQPDDLERADPRVAHYVAWHRRRDRLRSDLIALDERATGESHRLEAGYRLTGSLLDRPERPDALVTTNDNMAIGAYRAIQERGLTIPGDIAVVSFNDIPVAQFLVPPLSTVRIQSEAIGEVAVELLAERLGGRGYGKQVRIATEFILRESCRG
ncbi:LacI family transcriptional regulator (plasmid) [Paracoccus yeei]|uniref:LacI family transcriptional regulator n=1 Tax=Paracoccus yeei TaxID=147645 RepID=A0A386UU07_9RHOB|nr:LacI family DNA-binding transcriptional regulator [Paracoccus yeei]AYF04101.1 LacI family transcriptional regulator [Paracoccus yeei]